MSTLGLSPSTKTRNGLKPAAPGPNQWGLRVLHLTLSFTQGGRRRAITTLAQRLAALGVRCDLCCVAELGCPLQVAANIFSAVQSLNRRSIMDDRALRRLTRFCDLRQIDVIHSHDAASQAMAALVRVWRPHIRALMTFHRSLAFESRRFRDRLRNAVAAFQCDAIVTGSRERRQHFLGENYVNARKVIRIPFGIDTKRFRPNTAMRDEVRRELGLSKDALLVGAIGHFRPEKGLDQVVRGFAHLTQRPNSGDPTLVILGDGTPVQRDLLRHYGREVSAGRVHYAGFRADVERWLQAWDIFVHAPRLEAFGLVVAEAMATGLPVIATPVGGVVDLVRDGETGILVAPDSLSDMANALEKLLGNAHLRITMGQRGQEIARAEFADDLYAQRHLQLYMDIRAGEAPKGVEESNGLPQAMLDGLST